MTLILSVCVYGVLALVMFFLCWAYQKATGA